MHPTTHSRSLSVAVLTISDTRNFDTDTSGKKIIQHLQEQHHTLADYQIVLDEPEQIQKVIANWSENPTIQVIICNGGTGFSSRDQTFETLQGLFEKEMIGFGELFRAKSFQEIGPRAMFSRATAGCRNRTAIYSIPGSTGAVNLAMKECILPTMIHFVEELSR